MRACWAPRSWPARCSARRDGSMQGTSDAQPMIPPEPRDMLRRLPAPPANPTVNSLVAAIRLPSVLWRYRELLVAFVRRELKARIEGSILGRVWPVLQPAVLFTIYYMIFVK